MQRNIIASSLCCWLLIAASTAFGQTTLFEKTNLADWDFHAMGDGIKAEDVFSFTEDGRLICKGQPFGYLATKESYKNFKLALEWCWPEGSEPTNSGIFVKITEQPAGAFLPKSVEVQLQHRNAGDIWAFHGRTITEPENRLRNVQNATIGRFMGVGKLLAAEKEPGQWNAMEILCFDGLLVVTVNGIIVNWTTGAEPIEGRIGFQSEGGPIEFRNAVLTALP